MHSCNIPKPRMRNSVAFLHPRNRENCFTTSPVPCCQEDVAKRYKLGGMVMESTNRGMEVLWGTRLSDGKQCVVKTRQKGVSFKSPAEERNWRSTTEVQMSMPKIDKLCEIFEAGGSGHIWSWSKVKKSRAVIRVTNLNCKLFNLQSCDPCSAGLFFHVFPEVLETPQRYLIVMEKVEGYLVVLKMFLIFPVLLGLIG